MIDHFAAYLLGFVALIFWQVIAFFSQQSLGRNLLISLFILYLSAVLSITTFPVIFDVGVVEKAEFNFLPFHTIAAYVQKMFHSITRETALLQVFGNILLAIPYGVVLCFLLKKKRGGSCSSSHHFFPSRLNYCN